MFVSTGSTYDVADDERGEEEQAVAGHSGLRLNVDLMDGDHLPLWCGRLPHHLQMVFNNNCQMT